MKKIYTLLVTGLIITASLLAQTSGQEFTNRMNHIFQYVDKSRITTGLLSDYGLQMVEPKHFNGVPADSNYVDMDTWRLLYTGMFTSKINSNVSLTAPETVFAQIDNATHATAVPLAMMHYQYNALNENSLNLNLLRIVNSDQLQDVPGATSPYLTRQLFAVAPKKLEFESSTVSFVFNSSLVYANVYKYIQNLEINFNNESGFLSMNWDTPISYTFGTGDIKTIYFRVTYGDGTSYTSQTNIYVEGARMIQNSTRLPDIPIQASSQHSGGTVQIKLSSNNNTGQIRKPLIVAEGLDPSSVVSSIKNNNLDTFLCNKIKLGVESPINSSNGRTLYNDLDLAGYDIVYLDYNNGVDDIWRNAELFKEVIRQVNGLKQGSEPNIVMGLSMGGLVARIALRQMEIANENHQASKYISVDSPHKGANIPVGLQAAVRHIQNTDFHLLLPPVQVNLNYLNFDTAREIVFLLNSAAAKQMLIYYVNQNYGFDNSVHTAFQQAYDQLGFPQQCQNSAVSNGSNNGKLSFAAGSAIIDGQFSYNFKAWMDILSSVAPGTLLTSNFPQLVLNSIPGHSEVKVDFKIDALKSQASRVYHGEAYIRKKVLFFISANIALTEKSVSSPAGLLPLDGAPGGYFELIKEDGNLPVPPDYFKQSKFSFIPTGSALALNNWTSLTQSITASTSTPFHSIFTQGKNESHVNFNSPAFFVYGQLVPIPTISGPGTVYYEGNSFALNNAPAGTVTWSVSGPFTVTGNGTTATVTRTGTSTSNGTLTAILNGTAVATLTITPCSPATISGPASTCGSTVDYSISISTLPAGTTASQITWTCSSNLSPQYGNNGLNKRFNVTGSGSGWVRVHIATLNLTLEKNVFLTPFPAYTAHTIQFPYCGETMYMGPGIIPGVIDYRWEVVYGQGRHYLVNYSSGPSGPPGPWASVSFYGNGYWVIHAYAITACGESPDVTHEYVFQVAGCRSYSPSFAYPNPVSGILTIDVDAAAAARSKPVVQSITGAQSLKPAAAYDLRLYDGQGNLLRQRKTSGGTVEFNVANLPNGVYYLHIYDGTGEKPNVQQIVIEH